MTTTNYIVDYYIEFIESYVDSFGYEINQDDTIDECACHVMDWCNRNNHDLDSMPLPELECIVNLYFHSVNKA